MTTPTDAQLAALGAAFDAFARRFKLAEACGGEQPLNEIDKQTLFYVASHGDCGPTDIARYLNVAGTTLTSATDRLVKRGLLARERVAGDRRAVALRLTEAGQAKVRDLEATYHQMYRQFLDPLTPSEQDTLIQILTKVVQNDN